jgi:hypothetical protein
MPCVVANYDDPTLTFTHSASDPSNLTTYTYSTVALGTESADRKILLAVHTNADGPGIPTSAVINGVSATLLSNTTGLGLFIADVPTGTSVTITATFSTTASRSAIGVWSLKGVSRPSDIFTNLSTGTGTVASTSVTARRGDAVVAIVSHRNAADLVWTGGTERYDLTAGNLNHMGGADTKATADTTAQTFTATSASSQVWAAISASFK